MTGQHTPLIQPEALQDVGLQYVSCSDIGYKRENGRNGFIYKDTKGRIISNPKTLERIALLKIPPAWKNVWICPRAYGHIQATGRDDRGRKQYRYHDLWNTLRKEDKFTNLYHFGKRLPLLEKHLKKDLRQKQNTKPKVCALALAIMNKTYLRAGNTYYEKTNQSFGLTTLRNRHLNNVSSGKVFFRFKGKKGIMQQIHLQQKSLINMLRKVKEIPGQRLFQYYDEQGNICHLESGDLNDYLTQAMNGHYTCKNFRTWHACLLTLQYLSAFPTGGSAKERQQSVIATTDRVAEALGNTRTVTRNHYIHPHIFSAYLAGALDSWIKRVQKQGMLATNSRLLRRKLLNMLKASSCT